MSQIRLSLGDAAAKKLKAAVDKSGSTTDTVISDLLRCVSELPPAIQDSILKQVKGAEAEVVRYRAAPSQRDSAGVVGKSSNARLRRRPRKSASR